jgi:hypothetical protein
MRMSDFRVVDANGVELRVGQWIGPADCPGEIIAINEPEGDYSYELERFVAVGGGVILRYRDGVEERFGIWSTARGWWDDASQYRAEDLELLGDGSEPAEDAVDDVDVEYERAQASEAWERRGGGGL